MAAILDSAICTKNLHSCILTQLDDGSHLEFCHLRFSHFAQKNFTCSFWFNLMMAAILNSAMLDSAILHKKNFHLSFWLNLMMMALLNSDILDSETAILDSVTLLSSLTFTEKHSHCTLTPTQTNSIWLKLLHSHSTWWFQPSWTLPSFIQPFCTKKLYSIILTQLDDGSHLEFCLVGFRHCHLGFKHLVIFSQIHSKTLSLHSDSDSN